MTSIEAFAPTLDPAALTELRSRLAAARLPGPGREDWTQGVPSSWLRQLIADWLDFDLDAFQQDLDLLPHFMADVDGRAVHLIHVPGRGPNPMPLLLTHGWPGSFLEFVPMISRLTDPQAHGADAADAFTVVIPSLPGYGFSAPPPATGFNGDEVAALWHQLMTDGLGYGRYVAHGSDIGAGVTARLARAQPQSVAGIHLATPGTLPLPAASLSSAEQVFFDDAKAWLDEEGGYNHEHSTKPATLAAGLADSPTGLAAWIGEKIVSWSSVRADGQPAFDRDLLLGTLTLYWATDTIGSSLLAYWTGKHRPMSDLRDAIGRPVPTAITNFGGERVPFPKPPRELAARYFQLSHWAEHDRGGHFPGVAEPDLLAAILREAFRPLRPA